MKTFWTIFVTVIVVGVLAGGGTYYYSQNAHSKEKAELESKITNLNNKLNELTLEIKEKNNSSPTPSGSTKTYENKTIGLTINYPSSLYLLENDATYTKMCEKQIQIESGSSEVKTDFCPSDGMVASFSNINGFCTKAGCVGKDLESIKNAPMHQLISLSVINDLVPSDYLNKYGSSKVYSKTKKIIDGVETYVYEFKRDVQSDGIPSKHLVWAIGNKTYDLATATETRTETEEMAIFDQMVKTLSFK